MKQIDPPLNCRPQGVREFPLGAVSGRPQMCGDEVNALATLDQATFVDAFYMIQGTCLREY